MKIAVEGCCHGELDNIYHTIETARMQAGIEAPDALICCGDFQSFRNHSDLQTFAAPPKYRQLGSFWKYYNGEKVAPILTIFVGGNHEASGYLWELYHGGWVAPNIYFLGFAGSVILKKTLLDGTIESIRISGVSGIFKKHDYHSGHHERIPYDNGTIRSIYHVREYDIFRMSLLPISSSNDIFVSHDWPVGIEQHGNTAQLLRAKPFFRDEVASNTLGSPPLMHLLRKIKPHYWFSAHLHVKFAALYRHDSHLLNRLPLTQTLNPDELQIDSDGNGEGQNPPIGSLKPTLINPDMILIDDSDDEKMTLKEPLLNASDPQTQSSINDRSDIAHLGGCSMAPMNPDEVQISPDDEKDEVKIPTASSDLPLVNPDIIPIDISDDEGMPIEKTQTDHSVPQTQPLVNVPSEPDATQSDVPLTLNNPEAKSKATTITASAGANAIEPQNSSNTAMARTTRFLALDKCLPRKDFLQILDIIETNAPTQVPNDMANIPAQVPNQTANAPAQDPHEIAATASEQSAVNSTEDQVQANPDLNIEPDGANSRASLFFDPQWLAITRAFHPYMPLQKYGNPKLPNGPTEISSLINQELEWVNQNISATSMEINNVQRFVKTAPGIGDPGGENTGQPLWYTNPQTVAFTELLGIENKINSPTFN